MDAAVAPVRALPLTAAAAAAGDAGFFTGFLLVLTIKQKLNSSLKTLSFL
jgi:hypothetical protein